MKELTKISSYDRKVALVETWEEIKLTETEGAALALMAKKMNVAIEGQNKLGRTRIDLEKKKGAKLNELFPQGGDHTSEKSKLPEGKLAKMPVTPKESTQARLINKELEFAEEVMKEIEEKKDVITPNKVASNIKKKKRKQDRENLIIPPIPNNIYRIIYADPPWEYNDKKDTKELGGAVQHYPTMSLSEICEMELPHTEDNAVLFLWTTSPMLEDTFKVINAWKFKYKTSFVWNKINPFIGHYNHVSHEFLLIATKGSCTPDNYKFSNSVQTIKKSKKHSEKPEEFRKIIDTLYTHGNRIEMFARINKTLRETHPNWDFWGLEIDIPLSTN